MSAIAVTPTADRLRWEQAYRQSFPGVYRALVAMGARADEAEDALHDAFLRGIERGAGSISSVDGWIFVVASRAWRRRRMRERVFLPWTLFAPPRSDPEVRPEHVDALVALRALPLRQRQVVVARLVLGLSQEETAELLGIARGTVAATTNHAMLALRKRLEVQR